MKRTNISLKSSLSKIHSLETFRVNILETFRVGSNLESAKQEKDMREAFSRLDTLKSSLSRILPLETFRVKAFETFRLN